MIYYFNFSSSSSIMSVAFPKKSNISRSSSSLYCRQRLIVDWDKELNNCFTFAFPAVSGTMITRRLSSGSFFLMTYPAFSSRSMSAVTEPVLRPVFFPSSPAVIGPASFKISADFKSVGNRPRD